MATKKKGLHSWACKTERHDGCNGVVLLSSIATGIEGLKDCKCECHVKESS